VDYLEDEFSDVISKAQRGLGLATSELATRAGLAPQDARALRSGETDGIDFDELAGILGLRGRGLRALAEGDYNPPAAPLEGFIPLDAPAPMEGYAEMRVNSFIAHRPGSDDALVFDPGTEADTINEALRNAGLRAAAIFITHSHWDHHEALPALRAAWPEAIIYGTGEGAFDPQETLRGGERFEVAGLHLDVRSTPGHATPSLSFVIEGLARPVAIVGDAIFAASVGGIPPEDYASTLQAIRTELLTLPDDTLVAPGHGRLTTIGFERANNPFFPE